MPVILAIDGSPTGSGRTAAALRAVAGSDPMSVADAGPGAVVEAIDRADAVALGSPVHRASFAHPLKALLDGLPRGMWGEARAPLQGKAVAIVATGATLHHFLALADLRNVLAGFFAAHVLPPGLYVPHTGFDDDLRLLEPYADQAAAQGRALVELADALADSTTLRHLVPQA